jgi:EpsI family protein
VAAADEVATPPVRVRQVSTTYLGIAAVVAAGIAALWPSVRSLLAYWNDYDNLTYSHGYLIAAICSWLFWRARMRLTVAASTGGSPWGAAVLGFLTVAWAVAYVAGIEVAHQLLLPVLLVAGVWSFAGVRAAVVALLPAGYLVFAIPVWSLFNGLLQQLTVVAVTFFLKAMAIPARFDENVVHLGSGSFEIAGGCSGLHFVIVALAIAVLYGEIGRDRWRTRLALGLIAAGMAVVMNWIRVTTIILAGYFTDMQSFLVQVDHYYFGWALFGVLLAVFYWGVPRWLHLSHASTNEPVAPAPAQRPIRAQVVALGTTLLAMLLVPVLVGRAQARQAQASPASVVLAATDIPGWEGPLAPDPAWTPQFPQADARSRVAYRRHGRQVEVFVAAYAFQSQGKEVVGYGNSVLGDGPWRAAAVAQPRGADTAAGWLEATKGDGTRWRIASQYGVGGRTFANGLVSKLYYPFAMIAGHTESRIVVAAARCGSDCDGASSSVGEFMAEASDVLLGSAARRSSKK